MKKAKIIVLSGQSNAVGVGHVKCLKRNFSEEKIEEYFKGYENIKINYYSHDKKSDGFTITKKGCTEIHKDTIGPELGMAEYLNENFPGEEFYIVKFAVGGANLKNDFLSPSGGGYYDVKNFKSEYNGFIDDYFKKGYAKAGWCYNGLVSVLNDSIEYLKDMGLSPEIIGFCWMQGESDSTKIEDVDNYRTYFDNFINDFKTGFSEYLKDCVFADAGISDVWQCCEEMNMFKKEYAQNHSGFVYVDTIANGLTTRFEPVDEPDIAHFDCGSVIKLGKLFMEAIIDNI